MVTCEQPPGPIGSSQPSQNHEQLHETYAGQELVT